MKTSNTNVAQSATNMKYLFN